MQNKKGFSLIGMLITVTIIMILTVVILKKYQTLNTTHQTQMQQTLQQLQPSGQAKPQNALQQVRSSVQDLEKAAARRAEQQEKMYK